MSLRCLFPPFLPATAGDSAPCAGREHAQPLAHRRLMHRCCYCSAECTLQLHLRLQLPHLSLCCHPLGCCGLPCGTLWPCAVAPGPGWPSIGAALCPMPARFGPTWCWRNLRPPCCRSR